MKIVILAAGYAVRLEPYTLKTPKPLLEVGGKRILDRLLEKIAGVKDARDIHIVANAKFFDKFTSWRADSKYRDRIFLLNDGSTCNDNRLGAIKDLELVTDRIGSGEDLLVIAGDNLFDFALGKFTDFAKTRPDGISIALYDIGSLELAKNFGVVEIDSIGRVVNFQEKPPEPKSTLISTGIYYFPADKIALIKEYVNSEPKLDAPGYYIGWLSRNKIVYGCPFSEDWYDIGNIESYRRADAEYKNKEKGKR